MYVPESAEREMLRQSLRRFLDRECPREKVRQWDEEDYYPRDVVDKLRALDRDFFVPQRALPITADPDLLETATKQLGETSDAAALGVDAQRMNLALLLGQAQPLIDRYEQHVHHEKRQQREQQAEHEPRQPEKPKTAQRAQPRDVGTAGSGTGSLLSHDNELDGGHSAARKRAIANVLGGAGGGARQPVDAAGAMSIGRARDTLRLLSRIVESACVHSCIGFEYECARGHRFFAPALPLDTDPIVHTLRACATASSSKVRPLKSLCGCDATTAARLQRIFVATARDGPALVLRPRLRVDGAARDIDCFGQDVPLPANALIVVRLPPTLPAGGNAKLVTSVHFKGD